MNIVQCESKGTNRQVTQYTLKLLEIKLNHPRNKRKKNLK